MKILLTGATGFLGREIADELLKLNFSVVGIGGKKSTGVEPTNYKAGEFFNADVADYKSLEKIEKIGTVDAVIHSAGLAHQFERIDGERFDAVNVRGTKNVARLAVKLKARQFILIGSTAVYGIKSRRGKERRLISEIEITETAECRPETVYAESKLAAEKAARDVCEMNNIALTILRLAPVLGEDNVGNAARLTEAIDGNKFLWVGAGENLKTLVYKRDAARACSIILSNKKGGTEIFNVAAEPVKMFDFMNLIADNLGKRIPGVRIPAALCKMIFSLNSKIFGIKKIDGLAVTIEK